MQDVRYPLVSIFTIPPYLDQYRKDHHEYQQEIAWETMQLRETIMILIVRHHGWPAIVILMIVCILAVTLPTKTRSDDGEIARINAAIQSQGGRWIAGETSISKLPHNERNRYLGALVPRVSEEDIEASGATSFSAMTMDVPPSLDWRSFNGSNFVTPVRDQGKCGSCWAFATAGALESQALIDLNTPGTNLNLAEQILISSCSDAGDCNGGYIDEASTFIRDTGLPLETCFPYSADTNQCSQACANWQSSTYGITNWLWVTGGLNVTATALKNGLFTYGPLVTTMDVYSDFYHYSGGIYTHTTGDYVGSHAILIVGYNEDQKYFLAKNSWGNGWGESGYFRIDYGDLSSDVGFGSYTIAYDSYQPLPKGCSYSFSPTEKIFRPFGGQAAISISSSKSCSWTATSNVSWVSIIAGSKGTGKGRIIYTVAWNRTKAPRTGTITIAGKTFTIIQSK